VLDPPVTVVLLDVLHSSQQRAQVQPQCLLDLAQVSDLAWNPNDDWVISSVAEDNIVQVGVT
jgi:hypothetical protein